MLPLVVRAGGGSPRDTLSLLDQLIAGSDDAKVVYSRAVSLLGYTHAELLDEVVDAFAVTDAGGAFAAVDRVVQTGQDPRRFVDDLLERLRDLIVIAATGQGASAVLRGLSADDLARMTRQAESFGAARLSRTADIVISALDEMTGATSPRLQLELMVARVLAHAGGVPGTVTPTAAPAASAPAAPAPAARAAAAPAASLPVAEPTPAVAEPVEAPVASVVERTPSVAQPTPSVAEPVEAPAPLPTGPVTLQRMQDAWPEVLARLEAIRRSAWLVASASRVVELDGDPEAPNVTLAFQSVSDLERFKPKAMGGADAHVDVRQAIADTLGVQVRFRTRLDGPPSGGSGPDDGPPPDDAPPPPEDDGPGAGHRAAPRRTPQTAPAARSTSALSAAPVTEWAVAPIPGGRTSTADALAVDDEPEDAASALAPSRTATLTTARDGDVLPREAVVPSITPDDEEVDAEELDTVVPDAPIPPVVAPRIQTSLRTGGVQRVGEAVVRQMLGATFVREEPYTPPTRFS